MSLEGCTQSLKDQAGVQQKERDQFPHAGMTILQKAIDVGRDPFDL
jgi:hypothetical protein